MSRALSMQTNDNMSMMTKDELGDYHIYSLNETHDLGAKENITVRMYGPLDVGYEKKYVFENTERRQKKSLWKFSLQWTIRSQMGLEFLFRGR